MNRRKFLGAVVSFLKRVQESVRAHRAEKYRAGKHPLHSWDVPVDGSGEDAIWSRFGDDSFWSFYMGKPTLEDLLGKKLGAESDSAGADEQFALEHPSLAMLMMATPMMAGKRRKVCTLTIVFEDGMCKAGIRERDQSKSLWVSSGTLYGVFDALETALQDVPVRWRHIADEQSRGRAKG